jgi:hypothetical protein
MVNQEVIESTLFECLFCGVKSTYYNACDCIDNWIKASKPIPEYPKIIAILHGVESVHDHIYIIEDITKCGELYHRIEYDVNLRDLNWIARDRIFCSCICTCSYKNDCVCSDECKFGCVDWCYVCNFGPEECPKHDMVPYDIHDTECQLSELAFYDNDSCCMNHSVLHCKDGWNCCVCGQYLDVDD